MLPDFRLETHFSKWEFKARYHMTQGGGAIINISTFAAFEPNPFFPTSSCRNEIASVVAFLASVDGAYITGQNIHVDGEITRSV